MTGDVVVIGSGGHAKVVVATLQSMGLRVRQILDDDSERWSDELLGIPIGGPIQEVEGMDASAIVAIGDNKTRRRVAAGLNVKWITATHISALVHSTAQTGKGSVIMARAVVQPGTRIGQHAIINTGAIVEHDCVVGDYVHIAPGARVCGGVHIGEGALVGAGATVIPNVRIGTNAIVGAGAAVVRDAPPDTTIVGVPAKPVKEADQ